jgi:putative transposase
MYIWRTLTPEQREELLQFRINHHRPWHGPPTLFQEGQFHLSAACYEHKHHLGRSSHEWNLEEDTVGRTVWHRCADRKIRSEGHYWATINYIHNNPVHHGYVSNWTDWPFSSARDFIAQVGRERAVMVWRSYPILDYGKGWDDSSL